MKRLLFAVLAAAACAGCRTVETSSPGSMKDIAVKGVGECDKVIFVKHSGAYFLWSWKLLGEDATASSVMKDVTAYAAKNGYDLADVCVDIASASHADVTSYGGMAGFFFGIAEASASATLRKRAK